MKMSDPQALATQSKKLGPPKFTALLPQVTHHETVCLVFITKVCDCNTTCTHNLAWQTILVNLAKACPLTELLVRGLIARFCKHHHLGLACIQSLGHLMKSPNRTIHLEGVPQDALACRHQVCAFLLDLDFNHGFCFIIRHTYEESLCY